MSEGDMMKNWFAGLAEKIDARITAAEKMMLTFGWNGIVDDGACY